MIGLNAEFEYPSHDKILKVWPPMQVLQNAATILTQKKGTQHTVDEQEYVKVKRVNYMSGTKSIKSSSLSRALAACHAKLICMKGKTFSFLSTIAGCFNVINEKPEGKLNISGRRGSCCWITETFFAVCVILEWDGILISLMVPSTRATSSCVQWNSRC